MKLPVVASLSAILICMGLLGVPAVKAQDVQREKVSVSAKLVLDAAGPKQRDAINAVYLMVCPKDDSAGTSFLLSTGVIVTNQHVVASCSASELFAISSANSRIHFTSLASDTRRDLAFLKPAEHLVGGLQLADDSDPKPGTEVTTWGYPLLYTDTYPLLSVGYIAGYRQVQAQGHAVKHMVVNAAFNHGNSGGPLMFAQDNKVIGVVVATYHFFPEYVDSTIQTLKQPHGGFMSGAFSIRSADGTQTPVMDQQVIGIILEEFYKKTQVMIGEAISGSEVRAALAEHPTIAGAVDHPSSRAR